MKDAVVAALTSHLIPDLDALPIGAWRAIKRLPESEIAEFARIKLPGKDHRLIIKRLERVDEFEDRLEQLSASGIRFVSEFSDLFPQRWIDRLGEKVPPYLFTAGNPSLLSTPSIGVVGSRDADPSALAFAKEVAEEAVSAGYGVVSGAARGVDEIAMRAGLDAGGNVVGLLADSLLRAMKKWDYDELPVCLATPFSPEMGFQAANAMSRNKLVYAFSYATVVVASDHESGGTWAGATEALKLNLCPVLVKTASLPGNRALVGKGGIALGEARDLKAVLENASPMQRSLL